MATIIHLAERRPHQNFSTAPPEAISTSSAMPLPLDVDALVHAIDICRAPHAHEAGPTLDAAVMVRSALRWTRRRGRAMSSLPQLIRLELEAHCNVGNATALMLRDWISGPSTLERFAPIEQDGSAATCGGNAGDIAGRGK